MQNKVLIIAGEASGDKYAANIAKELKKKMHSVEIFAIGGERVKNEGVELIEDMKTLTVVGLSEVIKHLPKVLSVLGKIKKFIKKKSPDFVILIDYPDFNFKVAKFAYEKSIPVFYFVSPQIWAWRRGRVNFIKKYVKKLFVIFPFEEGFYKRFGIDVKFVGHPLTEQIATYKNEQNEIFSSEKYIIALLPGSRNSEIKKLLEPMLDAAILIKNKIREIEFLLPVANSLNYEKMESFIFSKAPFVKTFKGDTYNVINSADLVISASGTATLEAALFGKPVIIVYKVSWISYIIGRLMIKVPFIGMPNLLLGKCYNPELIQKNATAENIFKETVKFIENKVKYNLTSQKNKLLFKKLHRKNTFEETVNTILSDYHDNKSVIDNN